MSVLVSPALRDTTFVAPTKSVKEYEMKLKVLFTISTLALALTILTPAAFAGGGDNENGDGYTQEFITATEKMDQWKQERTKGIGLSSQQRNELRELYKTDKDAFFEKYRDSSSAFDSWRKETQTQKDWSDAEHGYAQCGAESCLK
jgi:hypothetical protein